MRIAAIDQGTTSTRAVVLAEDGSATVVHAIRHAQHYPHAGWVEHTPDELLSNVKTCIAAAGNVDALGLDHQGESCMAWDAMTGEALSPVIVWQDNRTIDGLRKLHAAGAETLTLARAGLPLDAYFSASKLAWLLQHSAPVRKAHRAGRLRLGTTDAWFLDRLTGSFVTDASTASRTSLMNIETGEWDDELCRLFGVPRECLPRIVPTVGYIGSAGKLPLTASVVDQQAALYGHGCRETGDAKITFGTGAFALAVTGATLVRAAPRGLLPTVAWRIGDELTYGLDGGVYDAGAAVDWAGRLGLYQDLDELTHFDGKPAIARQLAFVPALSGLAAPHWDRTAGALWIGMQAGTSSRDLCRALLEGVAMRAAEVIAAIGEHVALGPCINIDGGLARNRYFAQFLAEILGRPVRTSAFTERTALGCANLAARGASGAMAEVARHGARASAADQVTEFEPRMPTSEADGWRAQFADAIRRSQHWRQPIGEDRAADADDHGNIEST